MNGPSRLGTAVLMLIFGVIASDALTVQETCALVPLNTYIADPASCQGWVYCNSDSPIYGKCSGDLLYNSARGICDYPEDVACNSNVTTMCTGLTDTYKADPYDCSNYCYCKDNVTYCASCPSGQYYDPSTVTCIWSANSKCVADSPCLLAQNGFMKNSKSCDGWIRCGSSQVVDTGVCEDLYFNAATGSCDYPENVSCSLTPAAAEAPPVPSGACTNSSNTSGFVTDAQSCCGYFYCTTDTDTTPTWGQCKNGTNFNPATGQCNDPRTVVCGYDRCEGLTNAFMAVAGTNCTDYYVCSNGVKKGTGTCDSPYLYFNEVSGYCETTALTYPICTEAYP